MDERQDHDSAPITRISRAITSTATVTILPPGATTVAAASSDQRERASSPPPSKTLGAVRAGASWRSATELFLTAALRTDQNSAFGTNFQRVVYPKASVSWLLSDESFFPRVPNWRQSVPPPRRRTAPAACNPAATAGLVTVQPPRSRSNDRSATTVTDTPGLIGKQPRQPEPQAGTLGGVGERLRNDGAEQPRPRRLHLLQQEDPRRADQRSARRIVGRAHDDSLLQNVGSTRNFGHELQINAQLVGSTRDRVGRHAEWVAQHRSRYQPRHRSDATGLPRVLGAGGLTENRAGDPINSQWYRPYTYNDDNKRRQFSRSLKSTSSPDLKNFGTGVPRTIICDSKWVRSLQSAPAPQRRSFDYKGGYSAQDGANNFQCNSVPRVVP